MGNDLISRSALRDQLGKYFFLHDGNDFMEVMRKVEKAPAVDAVEVVRCKDCESFGIYPCSENGYCRHDKGLIAPYPEDFCSYGERREDDETD